jgi:predicted CxxxxCH...CXXCH cytochrome family protein
MHGVGARGGILCGTLLLLVAACTKERTRSVAPDCVSYRGAIAALLDERCVGCHGGADPAGGYALDSYAAVLDTGSDDVSNAIAGDATSRLLRAMDPAEADAIHQEHTDAFDELHLWVVECDLAYTDSPLHEAGILDPRSADFHGRLLADHDWDFAQCGRCHGEAFEGGPADAPCTTCHAEGPTACETCHRPDLRNIGAHAAHLPADTGALPFEACAACHTVPDTYDAPGHIFTEDGALEPPPADVTFGPLAHVNADPTDRAGPPAYDPQTGTCQNVYCHGAVLGDANASLTTPSWFDVGAGQADCGTCHGLPPASHLAVQVQCERCHQRVAGADLSIAHPAHHVDGVLQVGHVDDPGCARCHGSGTEPAPPVDLLGRTSTDHVTIGAHQAHVQAPSRLRGPIPCADCHLEPTAFDDPGHVDSAAPAEVFPGGASFGGMAAARGAVPTWDRQTGRCADVYCHGGGALQDDAAAGVHRTPEWTRLRQGEAACGRCHGIPPADDAHDPAWGLTRCVDCHASTVDAFGNIRVTGPPGDRTSTHIDGVVDVP